MEGKIRWIDSKTTDVPAKSAGLPYDMEYEIISYIQTDTALPLVCKRFYAELKKSKQVAAKRILYWYRKNRVDENSWSFIKLMRRKFIIYTKEMILEHPEFVIRKMQLEEDLLDTLPPIATRTKRDVKKWYISTRHIISDDWWKYVGF